MKTFVLPKNAWLPTNVFDQLVSESDQSWHCIENHTDQQDPCIYMAAQNQAMLIKFFLEQAFVPKPPVNQIKQIIQRDFGNIESLAQIWNLQALKDEIGWIVFGLSFADFRFHIFPITTQEYGVPFSISPMLCTCLRSDIIALSGMSRQTFAETQWKHINWEVVELRVECLQKPLNVFEDAQDCVEDVCIPATIGV
jgi:superoxide dismutase